jgi:glycosyltransferase involved in cell wall biosynthesis
MCREAESTVAVIPALNEQPVIARTLRGIPRDLIGAVIVADNGSTDETARVADTEGALVVYEPQQGYGAACLKALAALPPHAKYVVFLQADASEDANEAIRLLQPLFEGEADLVIGSRVSGQAEPGSLLPHQRFGNWLACFLIRWLYGFHYSDLGPFRAITVEGLQRLRMRDRNYGWTVEMQIRAIEERLRVREVPVSYRRRAAGVNKVSGNLVASFRAGQVILSTVFRLWLTRRSRTDPAA